MSNIFCVNKSGRSIPVYSDAQKTTQIGTIYNREAFGFNRNWGGDYVFNNIAFLHSSGYLRSGFIVDPPEGALTPCTDYPYGTAIINGREYKTFIMRKSRDIYTASGGTKWGSVAAGKRVACLTALSGDTNPHWKAINYVENSSTGQWDAVTGDGVTYGYVDTGLDYASGYSKIPLYGSW